MQKDSYRVNEPKIKNILTRLHVSQIVMINVDCIFRLKCLKNTLLDYSLFQTNMLQCKYLLNH